MKKAILTLGIIGIIFSTNAGYCDGFDNIENLTPTQKQKLVQIQQRHKFEYNNLETKIMDYTNKLNQVETDLSKTPDQVEVLRNAYQRNLTTLKNQQAKLEQETDSAYKTLLTAEQYAQLKSQQNNVQEAFDNWLRK